ncbi:dermonecrotic toxin domain-containing protein [Pseudomonas sp. 6D_7.1_Bac1]|uniref:dermonecrotic toxin domain-containing protein n=1 Tax=Pseudomonas sp. 6D_7.1_Bac1 TaxID=2971615 RepID=UPI0021C60F73|nr:DUF6543 domain-containing protein [Pseudomonas sp. 6D_7.1_Bac1]MCU1749557.1 hypothetical protein [Pseudomonas sp. 6D_7.1_Bac1]
MPNPPLTLHRSDQATSASADNSIHYALVKKAIPSWLLGISAQRVNALKTVRLTMPDWHRSASAAAHQNLKNEMQLAWNAQNDVDQALSNLQDVHTFAKPLLQKTLKDRFGIDDDVEDTWLRLYAPAKTSWWVNDFASGTQSRTVSLLDAALHNFSSSETFTADSEFITRPDVRGHFAVKRLKHKISIDQFKALCRELNIGAQYQQHLNEFLLSSNRVAGNVLRHKVIHSQKSTLRAAARMALMKNDIGQNAYDVVLGMTDERKNLHWNGQSVSYYNLAMMDVALTGIVLIAAETFTSGEPVPLIAYVPHDPEHPLKQYPSSLEFMAELTRQLRDTQPTGHYQQFFSQFVAHQQRGHFFAGLNDRLSKVKWQPAPPGSNLPSWRETPVDNPNLQFRLSRIQDDRENRFTGDLWGYVYRQKLNKIFNDAQEIAIPTEYADRMARWAWWDNLEKMLSDILNVALLVATPFVPYLGELMLAYTAFQLTDEVFEGIVDLAEGRLAEAAEQAIGVLESVVQLAAFAAGLKVGSLALVKLSPFIESMKPVQLADGQTRLWSPDLSPYQQPELALPADARPDALGIYQHQGKQIVRLDKQLFEVEKDPVTGQHRIKHPQRPDAYAPTLTHNGHGAWVSETENPRLWEDPPLMRRLGHTTDAFSDTQLEQIRQISSTDETVLRRMHVENAPPPPLLIDTLQRLGSPVNAAEALSPDIALMFTDFPELPENIVERIMASATASERQQIAQNNRLPLRLKNRTRELQFEVSSVRAAQGLYHDSLSNIDTERLVLGALRIYTDTFGDLRIEIRQGTFDGELRCSAGPEDATQLRVLIRNDAGKYQVRDGSNQPIHEADGLLEAILQATQKNGRNALGYKPGDAEFFRQWVIAKTAPPSERRTVLAQPPIRAIAERDTELLVRGGALSRGGVTLHERIEDLHPHFSASEIDAFAEALIAKGESLRAIEQQENDLDELHVIVRRWELQQPKAWGPGGFDFRDNGGQHIAERLIDCFERKNTDLGNRTDPDSYSLDLSRELLPLDLQTWWSKRPELKKFLDKVRVLKLDNTRFSSESNGLLKDFPNLRELSAKGCELTRLPQSIGSMHRLERLRLSDNQIVLDAPAVEQLKNLTYLEILRLENNPLALPPHIGRMPRLTVVTLKNTGLSTWPEGALAKPRPRGFFLDLRDNPITRIPEVVPGSSQAAIVARTRLSLDRLTEPDRLHVETLRRSVGLPAEPVLPSAQTNPALIISNQYASLWRDVPGWGVDRDILLSELIDEPDAESFAALLVDMQNSADYRAGGETRANLLQRLWRMMDAVHIDTRLREKLFTMAIDPVRCADAGAQLFNNMGIEVLASEAYSYSTSAEQLEQKLVTLAKGAARLETVNEIARADMASRPGNPDEVEVYLAYQTGLVRRLNLPWQSEYMLFREVSGVSDEMIDQAYDTVMALSEGDGLVNRMLEQEFWENYLLERYPVRMETNKRRFQSKAAQLDDLQATQRQWADKTLAEFQRRELKNRLATLMDGFSIAETEVFVDEPISDAVINRLLVDLGDEEKGLARNLTRAALRSAGQ